MLIFTLSFIMDLKLGRCRLSECELLGVFHKVLHRVWRVVVPLVIGASTCVSEVLRDTVGILQSGPI